MPQCKRVYAKAQMNAIRNWATMWDYCCHSCTMNVLDKRDAHKRMQISDSLPFF